jgi:SSS family solute:Na+ symporter
LNLTWLDWTVMLVYFAFVLGIGVVLKRYMKPSTDLFWPGARFRRWSSSGCS